MFWAYFPLSENFSPSAPFCRPSSTAKPRNQKESTVKGALDPRAFLEGLFHTACAAADPMEVLPRHLPPPPKGRTVVVGAGKAASRMALAVEAHWTGPLGGLVVTRHGQR